MVLNDDIFKQNKMVAFKFYKIIMLEIELNIEKLNFIKYL